MEEIVFWKEVDVKDATNSIKISDEVFGGIVFVKRVVIPILSDQEIEELADKKFPFSEDLGGLQRDGFIIGFTDMQERVVNNHKN